MKHSCRRAGIKKDENISPSPNPSHQGRGRELVSHQGRGRELVSHQGRGMGVGILSGEGKRAVSPFFLQHLDGEEGWYPVRKGSPLSPCGRGLG
jgi:hypothetical protein